MGQTLAALEAALEGRLPHLSADEFPRTLAWREGLEGVTLLPLDALGTAKHPSN